MIDYKFDESATYIVAGTYGSDSMALIDMMVKQGVKPVVCSLNYHKFSSSDSDFTFLKAYCEKVGLVFEGFDIKDLEENQRQKENESYKDFARRVRYAFFKKIYEKYNAAALFLAHQQDDLIETYLLQKQRQGHIAHYGLYPMTMTDGMVVVRPLLNYSKQDLVEYDEENRVPFSSNVSKNEDEFIRSSLRRDVISKMSEIDREKILDEMRAANDESFGLTECVLHEASVADELDIRALIALPYDSFINVINKLVSTSSNKVSLKASDFETIRKFCLAPQPNLALKLGDSTYLIKEYDIITVGNDPKLLPYTYSLEKNGKLDTPYFELDFSMGADDRGIKEEDYPLTIRSALPSDTYVVHGYLEPVRRLYSVWKMPVNLRSTWPVFLSKSGKIIYVPRYRQSFNEYHTSILRMKTNN